MIIGTAEILLGVVILILAYIAYSLIKQLRTLEKSQARRIQDRQALLVAAVQAQHFAPQPLQPRNQGAHRSDRRVRSKNRRYSSSRKPRHLPNAMSMATAPTSNSGKASSTDCNPVALIAR